MSVVLLTCDDLFSQYVAVKKDFEADEPEDQPGKFARLEFCPGGKESSKEIPTNVMSSLVCQHDCICNR